MPASRNQATVASWSIASSNENETVALRSWSELRRSAALATGAQVRLGWEPDAVHLFDALNGIRTGL